MPSKPMIERARRGAYDELWTPKTALEYLLPYLPRKAIIWECAPGSGQLVDLLRESGFAVVISGGDFLQAPSRGSLIVTNPPFSKKIAFLRRARELEMPFAFLLPVTTLGVRGCQQSLSGAEIIFLPRRVDFTGKRRPWFAVAWITWGLNLGQQIIFAEDRHLERDDAIQGTR